MAKGLFAFVFDGFDEIAIKKREKLEREILALAHNNPENIVAVSGRTDDRFSSWQSFYKFNVQPLSKQSVIDLLEKLDYDSAIKKKFISRVKLDLYDRHESFLSTPLLSTLMLMTFNQFADIPEKIHIFYDQAFDTLFSRHDASKEAFRRKMYTQLPIDVFKRQLSYFCLLTYYNQKLSFSEAEILDNLSKSMRAQGISVSPKDFMNDLIESVCILQPDGQTFDFSHRSFQELFAAFCLAHEEIKGFPMIIQSISKRTSDNTIYMLFEMNTAKLEILYFIPQLAALVQKIKDFPSKDVFLKREVIFDEQIEFEMTASGELHYYYFGEGNDMATILYIASRVYPDVFKHRGAIVGKVDASGSSTNPLSVYLRNIGLKPPALFRMNSGQPLSGRFLMVFNRRKVRTKAEREASLNPAKLDMEWVRQTDLPAFLESQHVDISHVLEHIRDERARHDHVISDIFGIG